MDDGQLVILSVTMMVMMRVVQWADAYLPVSIKGGGGDGSGGGDGGDVGGDGDDGGGGGGDNYNDYVQVYKWYIISCI